MLFITIVVALTVALVELVKTVVTSFIDSETIPSWVWIVVTIAAAIGWSLVYSLLPAKVLDVMLAIAIATLFYDVIVKLVKGLINKLNDW